MNQLRRRIIEKFESTNDYVLRGLILRNLSAIKGSAEIPLVETLSVGQQISDGETIYCDLESDEFRVKMVINLVSVGKTVKSSFYIKFRREDTVELLTQDALLRGLDILAEDNKNSEKLHYLVTDFKLESKMSKFNFEMRLEDVEEGSDILESSCLSRGNGRNTGI